MKCERKADPAILNSKRAKFSSSKKYIIPKECGCGGKRVCILSTESLSEERCEEVAGKSYVPGRTSVP